MYQAHPGSHRRLRASPAKAVATAIGLAKALGAEIYTISVKEPFPYSADLRDAADAAAGVLRRAGAHRAARPCAPCVEACEAAGVACQAHTVEALQPWEAIIDHAEEQRCDLIVMALARPRGVAALLLGSETQTTC